MADMYCGPGGNDAWDGLSWPTRNETITGMMAGTPFSAGNKLYVGPGVYREQVLMKRGGSTKTSTGTVSLTEGSKIVTGSGTSWGVGPTDQLLVPLLGSGGDGVLNGAGGFSSATETFEDTCVGFCININGKGSYLIASVVAGPSHNITLTDVNGVGWVAGGGLTFWIPSNEGSYEIAWRDSSTQVTLKRPWSGPTYADRDYEIFRPVYLIGDETGANTDGIGGIVRITGSNTDLTADNARCIDIDGRNYWVVRGFQLDTASSRPLRISDAERITVEDCRILNAGTSGILVRADSDYITIRRCAVFGGHGAVGIELDGGGIKWTDAIHIENCYLHTYIGITFEDYNNVTIKSCMGGMASHTFLEALGALSAGACAFIHDCEIHYCNNNSVDAAVSGQIVANWNNYWDNATNPPAGTTNVGVAGATNYAYMYLPDTPILLDNYRYPVRFFPPSEWWEPKALLGLYGANEDIYGVARPTIKSQRSYGPQQDQYIARDVAVVYLGAQASLQHPDARTTQFRVPISGAPVTVTVWVYLEANYAGVAPKLVVHQPGNTDVEASATGTTDAWEQLSVAYVPNEQPLHLWEELVSYNTAADPLDNVYWQILLTEAVP